MRKHISRIFEIVILASITALNIVQTCWAGPPGPPVIITAPLGGDGILIATSCAIAGYGYWKSRK
jgi:hypothetical protein